MYKIILNFKLFCPSSALSKTYYNLVTVKKTELSLKYFACGYTEDSYDLASDAPNPT